MRRATAAVLGTVIGTTLLVAAKYGAPSATADTPNAITAGDAAAAGNDPAAGSAAPVAPGASGTPGSKATPRVTRTTARPQAGRTTPAGGGGGGTTTAPASCSTVTGSGQGVSSPGTGTVTVSIKVCNGAVSSASSSLSRSNWSANSSALPALNSLTPKYYKTSISSIHYSGATLTSNAYQASLRSALSKAGL
ncbi:MAG: hypothetical protein J2P15_20850 [Micromonosporaceae bacterium]|nr:hypothetical protein [Micromonosporaceae bacterium]